MTTYGRCWLDSWAGRFSIPCEILGECTRKGKPHYKVKVLVDVMRRFYAGQIAYPPRSSVTNVSTAAPDLSIHYPA